MIGSQLEADALARSMRLDAEQQLQRLEAQIARRFPKPATPAQRQRLDQLFLQVKRHAEGRL